jgi:saccharopine dehydrogenase (NAD+, L-lysine-forming)
MKIGLIREGKTPPDSRVALTPAQAWYVVKNFEDVELAVQPSPNRCFPDAEYREEGLTLQQDLSDRDVLLGVKEVPIEQLIPHKTYFFFSHTIKEQPYNRDLLRAILEKNIRLIDYEVLTDEKGRRLIAFGRFAGMVGAHNGIMTYGHRTGRFQLKRMKDCLDYAEARELYKQLELPSMKVVLTGTGRVGMGSREVLLDMGFHEVSPDDFLQKEFDQAVFTQLACQDYVAPKNGGPYVTKDFYAHPENYTSTFEPYTRVADVMINGIYWDNKAPAFFTKEDMREKDWSIQVIADVTCDIAPVSSIPSTLRASTIAEPVFGYDPVTEKEAKPFQKHVIDMMTIDNLPNELPRDASQSFGQQFIEHILPELLEPQSDLIDRATIARDGQLTEPFKYLQGYVDGEV